MNYFVAFNGLVYLCAAANAAWHDRWLWSSVWLFYGLSALGLAVLEGRGE